MYYRVFLFLLPLLLIGVAVQAQQQVLLKPAMAVLRCNAKLKFYSPIHPAADREGCYLPPNPCPELAPDFSRVGFLVDTSGSMQSSAADCPQALGSSCSRIALARWVVTKVLPARVARVLQTSQSDSVVLTGFYRPNMPVISKDPDGEHRKKLKKLLQEAEVSGTTALPQELEDIKNTIRNMIGSLNADSDTPLGDYIWQLAQELGNGVENRPNALVVISDGYSNAGEDPQSVANRIKQNYPYLHLYILDVVGNPGLNSIAATTGGRYFLARDADQLLALLSALSGMSCGVPPSASILEL